MISPLKSQAKYFPRFFEIASSFILVRPTEFIPLLFFKHNSTTLTLNVRSKIKGTKEYIVVHRDGSKWKWHFGNVPTSINKWNMNTLNTNLFRTRMHFSDPFSTLVQGPTPDDLANCYQIALYIWALPKAIDKRMQNSKTQKKKNIY